MTRAKFRGAVKSVTMWFNAAALAFMPFITTLDQMLPTLKDSLGGNLYGVLAGVLIAGNFLLRFKTNSDLANK